MKHGSVTAARFRNSCAARWHLPRCRAPPLGASRFRTGPPRCASSPRLHVGPSQGRPRQSHRRWHSAREKSHLAAYGLARWRRTCGNDHRRVGTIITKDCDRTSQGDGAWASPVLFQLKRARMDTHVEGRMGFTVMRIMRFAAGVTQVYNTSPTDRDWIRGNTR